MARTKITPSQLNSGATSSLVVGAETTTSTSYTGLTTPQTITVIVGASGLLLVGISSTLQNNTSGQEAHMSMALSGANTVASTDSRDILYESPAANAYMRAGNTFLFTGLTPGSTTITAQFRVSANTGNFSQRNLWALPV